ncbi:helix-turn-helix domain-containing protein [Paenibacillus hemerocallicola]|uniref:Helix-turn-helix domain-containing protein n=1 Tax=Paenibacillus hemerocallicola TaxID=1172614 RepID=A0A5C4T180_9BACL|nr:helix-turn-helix domain-containing protein [Paenibacillus hemerocallicola]TNJ61997.1 helix-turn-helix domain-containing protein [Paenibacillus hemerocallicola]
MKIFRWRTLLITGSYYKRLISFGLLTVCIPIMLVAFFSYTLISGHLQREVNRANLEMIDQMQQRIDASLQWVSKTVRGLILDPALQQYIYQNDRSRYIDMMQITDKLNAISRSIEYDNTVNLLLHAEHIVLSTTHGYEKINDLAGRYPFLNSIGLDSKPKWIVKPNERAVTYVQPLPLFTNVSLAYLTIDIQENALQSILSSTEQLRSGPVLLLDETGTLVSVSGPSAGIGQVGERLDWFSQIVDVPGQAGERTGIVSLDRPSAQIVYSKSPSTGWITVLLVPTSAMDALKAEVAYSTLFICLIAFIAGILLLYFNSRKLYAPIRSLLKQQLVPGGSYPLDTRGKIDEWSWIRQEWGSLKDQLGLFYERSKQDETALREFLFLHLIYGHYENESHDRVGELCMQHGLNPDAGWDVMIVEAENYELHGHFGKEDRSLILLAISSVCQDVLNQHNVGCHFVYGLETAHVMIVMHTAGLSADEHDRAMKQQIAETIRLYVGTYLKVQVSVGIGTRHDHPKHIRASYLEALEALSLRMVAGGCRTVHYRDLEPLQHDFRYPFELETAIVQSLQKGSRERVQHDFAQFTAAVTDRRYPTPHIERAFHMLYIRLVQTAAEMTGHEANPLSEMDVLERMTAARTSDDFRHLFADEVFPRLLPIFEAANADRGKTIVEAAVLYMREHASQDHSLTTVADYVGVSHSHFSRLFNKHAGQSFAQFVAELKIERSKELLAHTDKTVVEIAEEIGYTERTFRRVFKTLTGQTPAHYRQEQG